MSNIIIFGTNDYAQLAHYYLSGQHKIHAFLVDEQYKKEDKFCGLPVIADLTLYTPDKFKLFAPMSPAKMNGNRQSVYERFKAMGYSFINYISSRATVLTKDIGENNFILEDNTIQPFVKIGNNNVLWSGNHIGHHSVIGDHNTFTSHVVLSGHCDVRNNCFFGVNSTIRDGLTMLDKTLVAQGANMLSSATEANGVFVGNPAKRKESVNSIDVL